jgi:methionine aminopeptidase
MLHTFNATAYEVGDINRTNLEKYKFILPNKLIPSSNVVSINQEEITSGKTLELSNVINLEFFVNQRNTDISINSDYEKKMGSGTSIIINNNSNNSEKIFIPSYI